MAEDEIEKEMWKMPMGESLRTLCENGAVCEQRNGRGILPQWYYKHHTLGYDNRVALQTLRRIKMVEELIPRPEDVTGPLVSYCSDEDVFGCYVSVV